MHSPHRSHVVSRYDGPAPEQTRTLEEWLSGSWSELEQLLASPAGRMAPHVLRLMGQVVEARADALSALPEEHRLAYLCGDRFLTDALESLKPAEGVLLLIGRHWNDLVATACRLLNGRGDLAEELVHDVYLRLIDPQLPPWKSPDQPLRSVRAFLITCVKRRSCDLLRREGRHVHPVDDWDGHPELTLRAQGQRWEEGRVMVAQLPRQIEGIVREIGRFCLEESAAVRQTLLAYVLSDDVSWSAVAATADRLGLTICSKANFFRRIIPLRERIAALLEREDLDLPTMRHLLCDGCPAALACLWNPAGATSPPGSDAQRR